MTDMNVTALLADLARDFPALPGAACRGQSDLFDISDGRDRQAVARAQAVCANCVARQRCADWLASVPPHRLPTGVVAGRFVRPPEPRHYANRNRSPTKTDHATTWLAAYLTDNGPVLSTQLRADAAVVGIERHTLARARRTLGVELERITGTVGGQRM